MLTVTKALVNTNMLALNSHTAPSLPTVAPPSVVLDACPRVRPSYQTEFACKLIHLHSEATTCLIGSIKATI
jgi:hypothetical protein